MAITESYASTDPRHYVWWFPGSPIKVHLDLQVIEGLQTTATGQRVPDQANKDCSSAGSLDGATEILEFRPALNRTVPEMIAELSAESGELLLVGYYRTEHGDVLHLNEADLSLFERFFGKAYHVFLVIQPSAFAPPNATSFSAAAITRWRSFHSWSSLWMLPCSPQKSGIGFPDAGNLRNNRR